MEASHKFLFENYFDPVEPLEAEVEVEEEEIAAPPSFSEEEIALARAQGFAEGRMEGIAEMQSSIDTRLSDLMAEMIRQLAGLEAAQAQGLRSAEYRLLGLASTIAKKVVPPIARETAHTAVEDLIRECLPKLMDEPRVVIRVHVTAMDQLREKVDTLAAKSGFAGDIILLPEDEFAETDCRVEWADGGAEHSSAKLWDNIDKTIEAYLPDTGADRNSGDAPPITEAEAKSDPGDSAEPRPDNLEENLNG